MGEDAEMILLADRIMLRVLRSQKFREQISSDKIKEMSMDDLIDSYLFHYQKEIAPLRVPWDSWGDMKWYIKYRIKVYADISKEIK